MLLFCSCICSGFFFSPFGVVITLLGEQRANLSAFRTFVLFVLVWFCLFPLPLCLGWHAACNCGTPWTFFTFFSDVLRVIQG